MTTEKRPPPPLGRILQGSTFSDIVPGSASHKAGVRHGDVLLAVDNDLVERGRDQATELLKGTARAITLVVWRPRPDPSDDEAHQTSARDSAAAKLAKEARAGVGAVDVEYYTHNLLGKLGVVDSPRAAGAHTLSGMGFAVAPLPHKVPPFEDLTGC